MRENSSIRIGDNVTYFENGRQYRVVDFDSYDDYDGNDDEGRPIYIRYRLLICKNAVGEIVEDKESKFIHYEA